MPDFREWYKRLGFGRENVLVGRAIRSQRQNEQRHQRRSQLFGVRRDQNQCSDNLEEANSKEDTASSSKQRDDTAKTNDEESTKQHAVAKWRKERYRRKLVEKKGTKPPFVVGIVHHRLYSPPLSKNPNPSPPARLCKSKENQLAPVPVKPVTKATQNRRAAKSLESKQKSESKKLKKSQEVVVPQVPLAPKDHEFKAPEGVNAIPLFGRRALEAAQHSLLKTCSSTVANSSIASFISEEGSTLTPNNTSTPIPAPVACNLSSFMVCSGGNKDIARKELEDALSSSSENNFLDFLKNPFCEPASGQLQNESPTKLSTDEGTKTLTPKYTTEPNPPSAALSPFMVCSSDNGNAREELQKATANLFGANFLQTDCSKNLFHEFVHTENDFRKARASPKKLSHDEPPHALVKQTPLSSQPFKRLSPFKVASSDGDDTQEERLGTEKNYVKTDFSKNLFYEFVHIHPENSLRNEAHHASPKKLSDEEATLVEETDSLPAQLFNRLSPFAAPSSDEGGTRDQLQRSQEKYVQTDFSKHEENTTEYYRYLLNKETERLNGLCDSWDLVKKATSTPEDIQYLIQAAVGQTQLLIGKKFKRFSGLVHDCETGEGEMPVTCKDLLGFWELMFIEVEDCNGRFSKLEELKANGWIDKAAEQLEQKPAVKKAAVAKKIIPVARSGSLKAHIAAARKKMQNNRETVAVKSAPEILIQDVDDNLVVPAPGDPAEVQGKAVNEKNQEMRNNEEILSSSELRIPKIEINDVCVQGKDENSNVLSSKAPTSQASTPVNKLVLRKVHLPSKSPLIALKISKMCKTPEMFYVNTKGNVFERVSPRKSISPAKEDTPGIKSSKLKGKFLEFSPRKDDTQSSVTPRLTPQRRSLRIQKLNESKNHKNQDA